MVPITIDELYETYNYRDEFMGCGRIISSRTYNIILYFYIKLCYDKIEYASFTF